VNLLGFETSSAQGSVALQTPLGVAIRTIATPREQTEQILQLADELLVGAGLTLAALDGIAFGRGPGSFTGLRVSAAVVQGLAAVSNVPLLPVSSLLCLAERAWRERQCLRTLLCVDAHMGEVYWAEAACRDGVVSIVGAERLAAPREVVGLKGGTWAAVGGGFLTYAEVLAGPLQAAAQSFPDLTPSAEHLFPQAERDLAAGRGVAPTAALPVYLREHTAWKRGS
jgi:tRNA threonylcarbamoyladenosine biosynthesis protein TsaB